MSLTMERNVTATVPLLSVVATARNDNHGGNLLRRMQLFVDGLIEQCQRHRIDAELVLVDWNPPHDKPPLSEALVWPQGARHCAVRVIQVPVALHRRLAHSANLPLFQMIAKNVGIRRARGQYVLATNIDILFSDGLFEFLKSDALQPGRFYRVDRHDVPEDVPADKPLDDQLEYCRQRVIRHNTSDGLYDCRRARWIWRRNPWFSNAALLLCLGLDLLRFPLPRRLGERLPRMDGALNYDPAARIRRKCRRLRQILPGLAVPAYADKLHTNACGDFTLAARKDWFALRGYAELQIFSMHLDSLWLIAAAHHGLQEVDLGSECPIYHIEHGIGSGWTPEGVKKLNARLASAGIPQMSYDELLEYDFRMAATRQAIQFNDENWGLADETLPEFALEAATRQNA